MCEKSPKGTEREREKEDLCIMIIIVYIHRFHLLFIPSTRGKEDVGKGGEENRTKQRTIVMSLVLHIKNLYFKLNQSQLFESQ